MNIKLPLARSGTCATALLLGTVLLGAVHLAGQTLPPGTLPPGPPAKPGQLAPAEKAEPKTPAQPMKTVAKPEPGSKAEDTIRVNVNNVLVPTTVLDPDGHGYVNGLKPGDFELLDNDKPQKINADFTQLPMSVVLVVQGNAEIEPVLPTLRKSGLLLQGLVTGQENDVAVTTFDHRIQVLQDFTKDPEKVDDALQKLRAGSSTARLIDAVSDADRMLVRHDPENTRRRVIVLLSRNLDKGSEAHLQETARKMQFDNVIIYCIDISRAYTALNKKMPYPRPENGGIPPEALPNIAGGIPRSQTTTIQQQDGNVLNAAPPIYRGIVDLFKKTPAEAFATFTGGRVYNFAKQSGLEAAMTDIGADLNSQYLLSYSPNNSDEPGFHTIKINVDRPGLYVHARPGYWTGGGKY